jgi:hypothetical protein
MVSDRMSTRLWCQCVVTPFNIAPDGSTIIWCDYRKMWAHVQSPGGSSGRWLNKLGGKERVFPSSVLGSNVMYLIWFPIRIQYSLSTWLEGSTSIDKTSGFDIWMRAA